MKYEDWKKRFIVENPEKGGIIKNMVANDFEIKRENPKFTEYNPKADYSISIPGLPDVVNDGLSDACRRVAEEGSKKQCEILELIDLYTGKQVYYEIGDYDSVGGGKYREFIERNQNGKFAFVHNHPTDGFLSSTDMETFVTTERIQAMISISNDGLKRIAYGDIKDSRLLVDIFSNDVEKVRVKIRNGTLEMVEYKFELQKMLVEKSIENFANLGFWEVDGRV